LTYPDGRKLTYAYDAAGNRTSLHALVGGTTLTASYAYDADNRLKTVTDPYGRAYTYGYDNVGNRASLAQPNGITTTYAYDAQSGLASIASAVATYAYTLGPPGNRTQVDENDGTVRQYGYDDLYRLTGETVAGSIAYSKAFTYAPVGNRQTQQTMGQ